MCVCVKSGINIFFLLQGSFNIFKQSRGEHLVYSDSVIFLFVDSYFLLNFLKMFFLAKFC